ncbi:MAG: ABC transporter permease [Candidatus Aminicenantales bacterium]
MIHSVIAVIRKEILQISRDVRTLAFILGLPALLLLMFGFALNFDVKHIPFAVCDESRSAAGRELAGRFTRTEYFDLKYSLSDSRDLDHLMDEDRVKAALVIPKDFADNLAAGRAAPVQVIIDGTNGASASTAAGYVAAIVQDYSVRATAEVLEARGLGGLSIPLDVETRVWFNPELRSANFLVPGLMAFILMVIVVVSTAFSIVREKERGTMEQILVSPLRPLELIVGKTVPYVFLSLISSHGVLFLGYVLFGVSIKGNYFLLLLAMTLFVIGGLGQGLFISTITRTQQVAFQLALLSSFLPTFVLSGFIFPVRNMPAVIRAATYLIPARFFLDALRGIILKGAGIGALWEDLLLLAGFAALTLGASVLKMRNPADEGKGRKKARRRALR